jgi:hypothetical protein
MAHPRTKAVVIAAVVATLTGATLIAETPARRFDGRPTFSEGNALGYFVWREGDTWKVRWTTFGAEHRFNGRVVLIEGQVDDLKRVDVDSERRVIAPGRPARVVRGPAGRVRGVRGGRPPVVASREEDRIEQENERTIVFNARTDDDIDGFDFKAPGARRIRLVLQIDDKPRQEEVEVGRENYKPMETPLVATLN